jgi:O-antigen/teichoic acid export membrane protein
LAHDRQRAGQLFGRGINYTFLALFPLTLLVVALAHEVLTVWLGREFADNSAFVLKWLAAGVFINGIARVPFALVQGAGRPDLTAKMHLIELPVYLSALWWLIGVYGIQGVAIVWVVRVCIDSLILFVMAKRLLPVTSAMVRGSLARIIAASGILAVAGCLTGLLEKGLFLIVVLVCFPVIAWVWLLDEEDRDLLKGFLQPRYGGKDMHEP